jgi:hypothetical protein
MHVRYLDKYPPCIGIVKDVLENFPDHGPKKQAIQGAGRLLAKPDVKKGGTK